jgi:phthalate 4,5-dioxygenase reductase subunit
MLSDAEIGPLMALKVARAEHVAEDIRLFELRDPGGGDLPQFAPGAHIEVRAPGGLVRKYSLCNDPDERDRYQIAVKREADGRGGSAALVDGVEAGDTLEVSAPRNDFPLAKSPAGYTLIAGGIGITPILSMARHLKATGQRFKLVYLTRSKAATAFIEELSAPQFRGIVTIHHDGGDPNKALDLWPLLEKPRGHVYCCGPRGLMTTVRDMTGHWSSAAVHFEAFQEVQRSAPDDKPFQVRVRGATAPVGVPVGTTILEALRDAGYRVPSSCESGTCGSCRTRLLSGEVDHRDLVLGEDEKARFIMVCVSRAKDGEIEIELPEQGP